MSLPNGSDARNAIVYDMGGQDGASGGSLAMRWRFVVLGLAALVLAACGQAAREEEAVPSPSAVDGLLVFEEASYVVAQQLPLAAIDADSLEELGESRTDSRTTPVFRRQDGARSWELITEEGGGWVVWEPIAVVQARRDLAGRLALTEADIEVRQVERESWPDVCLGAPLPNEVCAQVITEGFRIELAAGAKTYRYHTELGPTIRPAP
jgi:hypothetical protein